MILGQQIENRSILHKMKSLFRYSALHFGTKKIWIAPFRLPKLPIINELKQKSNLYIESNQSDVLKCLLMSIYYAPSNSRIGSYSWFSSITSNSAIWFLPDCQPNSPNSKRTCCAQLLCSTRLYLLWLSRVSIVSKWQFSHA